jgi:hypothetical protein
MLPELAAGVRVSSGTAAATVAKVASAMTQLAKLRFMLSLSLSCNLSTEYSVRIDVEGYLS